MNTSLEVFQRTARKSVQWLDEIVGAIGGDRGGAYRALRGVLHVFRDRLSPERAAEVSSHLPMLIRGLYFEGWTPVGKPESLGRPDDLVELVKRRMGPEATTAQARRAINVVLRLLDRPHSTGELEPVRHAGLVRA